MKCSKCEKKVELVEVPVNGTGRHFIYECECGHNGSAWLTKPGVSGGGIASWDNGGK